MSNTEDWTINPEHYEYAKTEAKKRANEQWNKWMTDPNSINLWETYNTTQRQGWVNPWIEHELYGLYNGPGTAQSPLAYEVTQNAYNEYCFWKWKGHGRYATIAMLVIDWNETRMAHGAWQDYLSPYPASNNPVSLIGFNAEGTTPGSANWCSRGAQCTWTATFFDEYEHRTYSLPAADGSWDAVKKYYIDTYWDEETGFERVVKPLQFNRNLVNPDQYYQWGSVGYGIVQWTWWTRLVKHANIAFPGYGGKHWQFNGTLQLLVLDWERKTAMATSPADQHLPTYDGEWIDDNGGGGCFIHNNVKYYYGQNCTWDDWANDIPVTWCRNKCAELGITNPETIETYCYQLMLDIMGGCYLHNPTFYENYLSYVITQARYFAGAVDYWDANGGWDVRDIPRPRDIPSTELDKYHTSQGELIAIISKGGNKKRCRRRILLKI